MRGTFKIISLALLPFLVISCVDKEIEEDRKKEQSEIDNYISGKGFTDIGNGVYLKFYNEREVTPVPDNNIETGDAFIMNYDGVFIDETVWETTDSAKGTSLFPEFEKVYGSSRFRTGRISMSGFDTAIKYFSKGDTGTIVIPSWKGWYDYTRIFHIGMKEVIKNDTTYELEQLQNFFLANEFKGEDTIYYGVYWKSPISADSVLPDTSLYTTNPKMEIKITGRYAETYYGNKLGRVFYPITEEADTIITRTINIDPYNFPVVPAIDSALKRMKTGDIFDIVGGSFIGWGNVGYRTPELNIPIVPEYMPLHYRIEVLTVENSTE